MNIHTVSDITTHIKDVLEGDAQLRDVWVRGEASNCFRAASGHWYWTVKDADAALGCVMWKFQAGQQAHLPEDGAALLLHGAVSVYPKQGRYQLYVDHVEPVGQGDLQRRFEQLKAKLEAEGLFAPERRRPLPAFPRRIGIVTSADAAALRDVRHVLERRWPAVEVFVAPTLVQGAEAPPGIVAALSAIAGADVDLVIVTRGGGSIEDLWAFNDEAVARAIAACPVPVISGVGHETDFTIADFVADLRAPTPSAAAEIATPDRRELLQTIDDLRLRLARATGAHRARAVDGIDRLARRLELASPARTAAERRRAVAERGARLERALAGRLRVARSDLDGLARRLGALSPAATLARGFAHVRTADGRTVRSRTDVAAGDELAVRVADGAFGAVVTDDHQSSPTEESP